MTSISTPFSLLEYPSSSSNQFNNLPSSLSQQAPTKALHKVKWIKDNSVCNVTSWMLNFQFGFVISLVAFFCVVCSIARFVVFFFRVVWSIHFQRARVGFDVHVPLSIRNHFSGKNFWMSASAHRATHVFGGNLIADEAWRHGSAASEKDFRFATSPFASMP